MAVMSGQPVHAGHQTIPKAENPLSWVTIRPSEHLQCGFSVLIILVIVSSSTRKACWKSRSSLDELPTLINFKGFGQSYPPRREVTRLPVVSGAFRISASWYVTRGQEAKVVRPLSGILNSVMRACEEFNGKVFFEKTLSRLTLSEGKPDRSVACSE